MVVLQQLWDTAFNAEIAPLNAQIAALQGDVAVAQAALATAQASLTASQAQVASLTAQVATQQALIATLTAQVIDLQAQLAALAPPAPSPANTGYRGPLLGYSATLFPTAHDTLIANAQVVFSAPLSIPGANIVMKNGRFNASTLQPLTISGDGFEVEDFSFQNVAVTGKGKFTRCNFGSGCTLNGVSIIKDSYIKGTLSTFTGSTLTNNTVVP